MKIAIVGPCAAGKTTLAGRLGAMGYDAHDVAQEHSDVQRMWREIARPDVVIYLDVSSINIRKRLRVTWEQEYIDKLIFRLTDARAHAHFVLNTDSLTEDQACESVMKFLQSNFQSPTAKL